MPESAEYREFIARYPALQAIGNTPLVAVDVPLDIGEAKIYAKYEHLNPGGSVKDRPVLRMLAEAVLSGELTKDKTILDATSGNAGISYAMIGAILGFKVELVMPANASLERKQRIASHGASIVYTDPMLGYDAALREVKRRYEDSPDHYFYCNQYGNQFNPEAHYDTTAAEIIEQLDGITHFVAGIGTGGTVTGVGRRLKETAPSIRIVAIDPGEWPGVEGLKTLGEGHIVPETYDPAVVDRMIDVSTDEGFAMSRRLASHGYFAGQSTGAYMHGAWVVAQEERRGRIVTVFNDIGERYFSTNMWAEKPD